MKTTPFNFELKDIYNNKLCEKNGYSMKFLPRTAHWRERDDGLAMFVNENRFCIQDYQSILFHDCGDRVAQLMLLTTHSQNNIPPQQFICVNTHLLFPHNTYSTKIRLREVTKIMGFVESYKQVALCSTICGRSDIRLPVIIAGDFNGSPRGNVFKLLETQNYRSAIKEYCLQDTESSNATSSITSTSSSGSDNDMDKMESTNDINHGDKSLMLENWISHKSHLNVNVPVDQVFYLNPSEQVQ